MEKAMTHRARMEKCLSGNRLDRPPVALWRHFPVDDQAPERLAEAVLHFQAEYDFDVVKVTAASSYCLKDWGVTDTWKGNPEGTREYGEPVIHTPDDWTHLTRLDPRKGSLGDQLKALNLIYAGLGEGTPMLMTIFSPLAQAKHLSGPETLLENMRSSPGELQSGLETITQSTIDFVRECKSAGAAGIFYAVQHAQRSLISEEEYCHFGRSYDLRILEAAGDLWLNFLHLHGEDVYFDLLADYPVQVINWHDRETSYSLANGLEHTQAAVCGGLRQWQTLVLGTWETVKAEAADAIAQTGGKRFILGTGCVLPITAPHGNILAARRAVEVK